MCMLNKIYDKNILLLINIIKKYNPKQDVYMHRKKNRLHFLRSLGNGVRFILTNCHIQATTQLYGEV